MFGIPWKLVGLAGAALVIIGVIYAGYSYVNNLQSQVTHLTKENTQLELAKNGLQNQIKQLKAVQADIQREKDKATESDKQAQTSIRELQLKLTDRSRQEREQAIEQSNKASLYLRFLQTYEECVALHFDDFKGKCSFRGFVK